MPAGTGALSLRCLEAKQASKKRYADVWQEAKSRSLIVLFPPVQRLLQFTLQLTLLCASAPTANPQAGQFHSEGFFERDTGISPRTPGKTPSAQSYEAVFSAVPHFFLS